MSTNFIINSLGTIGLIAAMGSAALQATQRVPIQTVVASTCTADSNFQRLAFWVGDWDVLDSSGSRYAKQSVRAIVDGCAITAEWTGPAGNKGFSVSAYDVRKREWKQTYVSNQIPYSTAVLIRHSDSTYRGPGIRFIPTLDPSAGEVPKSRVTIMPMSEHRALQLFEESSDSGKTWRTLFKAEHRRSAAAQS